MAAGIDRGITDRTSEPIGLTRLRLITGVLSFIAGCAGISTAALAFQLISPAEAALPNASPPTFEMRGSPTRRPHITVVSPPPDAGLVQSPLDLKLRYRAFGGAHINPDTVVITYLKKPAIDITQRVKPFITATGIDIKQADVPPGLHQFWIELKDNDGRIGGTEFSFQVTK
jgi:hypothetical protein